MILITDDPKFLYSLRECQLMAREESHIVEDIKLSNKVFVDATQKTLARLPIIKRAKALCETPLSWNEIAFLLLGQIEIIFIIEDKFFEVRLPKRDEE